MKICCIFNIFPRYRRSIYTLLRQELGADIFYGAESVEGIATTTFAPEWELRNRYRGRKLVWQRGAIRRAFAKRYDVYILTGNAGILSNWIITLIARLLGRRVYLWSLGFMPALQSESDIRKNLLYYRLAGNVLLYGERTRDYLKERGYKNVWTVYNSLDYESHLKIRQSAGDGSFLKNYFGNELPTLAYLGRITAAKQVDLLLRAISELDCNLVLVGGGGSEIERLKELAAELKVDDKVWFYGESYDETFIGTLLTNAAATVQPPMIGLTAMHSLTFGTPVVTQGDMDAQSPECEAVTDGVTGYFFEKNSVEALRQAIGRAITTPKNSEACHQIIEDKYNPRRQLEIIKDILK